MGSDGEGAVMDISRSSRSYTAGKRLGESLCKAGDTLYLRDNRIMFLIGLSERLDKELINVKLIKGGNTWELKKI